MTEGNSPNDLIIEGIRLNLSHCEEHQLHSLPEHNGAYRSGQFSALRLRAQ